jgi:hypothetical protein
MMRNWLLGVAVGSMSWGAVAACDDMGVTDEMAESGGDELASEEAALRLTHPELIGRWLPTKVATGAGEFVRLQLKDDGTYTDTIQVYCIMAPCNPVSSKGRWESDGQTLTLTATNGGARQFPYTFTDGLRRKLDLVHPSGTKQRLQAF